MGAIFMPLLHINDRLLSIAGLEADRLVVSPPGARAAEITWALLWAKA